MIREICVLGEHDKELRTVCTEVDIFDYKSKKNVVRVLHDLMDTTKAHSTAVGLAANQIGEDIRVFVFANSTGTAQGIINPVIIDSSEETTSIDEGCLSEPGVKASNINRSIAIKVEGYDKNCMPLRLTLVGGEAIIFQHEMDHLNGKLITDYVELDREAEVSTEG